MRKPPIVIGPPNGLRSWRLGRNRPGNRKLPKFRTSSEKRARGAPVRPVLVRDALFSSRACALELLTETKLTTRREMCWVRLRLAYLVAQVCNANARDHCRVAKDRWRAGEVFKESNSRTKKNRRDVDTDFVEETSIQQLLDGVSAMDTN